MQHKRWEEQDWLVKTKTDSRKQQVRRAKKQSQLREERNESEGEGKQLGGARSKGKIEGRRRRVQVTAGGAKQDKQIGMATLKNCLGCLYFPVVVFTPQHFYSTVYYFAVAPTPVSRYTRESILQVPATSHASESLPTHTNLLTYL